MNILTTVKYDGQIIFKSISKHSDLITLPTLTLIPVGKPRRGLYPAKYFYGDIEIKDIAKFSESQEHTWLNSLSEVEENTLEVNSG